MGEGSSSILTSLCVHIFIHIFLVYLHIGDPEKPSNLFCHVLPNCFSPLNGQVYRLLRRLSHRRWVELYLGEPRLEKEVNGYRWSRRGPMSGDGSSGRSLDGGRRGRATRASSHRDVPRTRGRTWLVSPGTGPNETDQWVTCPWPLHAPHRKSLLLTLW